MRHPGNRTRPQDRHQNSARTQARSSTGTQNKSTRTEQDQHQDSTRTQSGSSTGTRSTHQHRNSAQEHQDGARSAPGQRQDTIGKQHWNRINASAPELSTRAPGRSKISTRNSTTKRKTAQEHLISTRNKTQHRISAPGISTGWSPTRIPLETFQGSIRVVTGCYVSLQTNHVFTDKR